MSGFSIDAVEPLDYDFTQAPSNSGKGMCKGKGTIPEPSEALLEAYSAAVRDLYKVEDGESIAKKMDADKQKETSDKLLSLTATLCQNSPSKAELKELPPRICTAFMKWVFKEIADPEVSSAATRR